MLDQLREKIKTAQDKDIEDRKGTQPKRYYALDADGDKMSKKTKEKRATILQNMVRRQMMMHLHTNLSRIRAQTLNHLSTLNNTRRCLVKTHVGTHMFKKV